MEWLTKFFESYPVFLKGMLLTFELTAVGIFFGIFVGLLFAFLKISKVRVLEWIADAYIFLVRGTPLIVQIFVFYYGLTSLNMSAFLAASLGLAFHNGAYIAEIFRGTIQSIDPGQMEAGRSLGMSVKLTYRRIILPQAMRRAMPPLGNQFIIALKDSSLAAFIGMYELFNVATTFGSNTFDYMTYLLIVAVYYLILVFLFSVLTRKVENRLAVSE
ncbi:amino acid ABC transporter permease [Neobacillus niacini]|uniref:amino acid ABC transporter permease n=1 Tax=Neobacillus niacini TaxID=86668 RepID=UPI0021CB10DC|nr:amino acid ABC transporter permease [Neobacillus niacini]MCM3763956.1 amino acid ABC transporter permease [Neobacillus niacini]